MEDRSWMDNRRLPGNRGFTEEFRRGVKHFIEVARSYPQYMNGDLIRCPCSNCKNRKWENAGMLEKHLYQNGFVERYTRWIAHGEPIVALNRSIHITPPQIEPDPMIVEVEVSNEPGMDNMIRDFVGGEIDMLGNSEEPNDEAKKVIELMKSAKDPLYPGAEQTLLETVAEWLNIKSNHNMSQSCYNDCMAAAKRMLPKDNNMVSNFYDTKKLVGRLGLSYEKIDACRNHCMLFYKEDENKIECNFCKESRYKPKRRGSAKHKTNVPWKQLRYMPLIPRLQRLYNNKSTAESMRW